MSFTATVSSFAATASGVVPTGTIQFSVDGNPVGDLVTLDGTATAVSAPISTLSTGSHTVTALFSGDVNYTTATSGDLSLNVGQASTSTTVTPSVNPSVFGQPVTFTANVAAVAPGVGVPTGTVQFYLNDFPLGGPATLDNGVATSPAGVPAFIGANNTVLAMYSGDADFVFSQGGAIQTMNQGATATSVVAAPNPSQTGESVTMTATVAAVSPAVGTPAGNVEFFDGTTSLGVASLTSGQASISTSALAIGSHSLTAVYAGEFVFSGSTSAAFVQQVSAGISSTVLTSSLNPSTFSNTTTLNATVSAVAPATGIPTGSVVFLDGTTSLGSVPVDAGRQRSVERVDPDRWHAHPVGSVRVRGPECVRQQRLQQRSPRP